jgi:hypothetical protein
VFCIGGFYFSLPVSHFQLDLDGLFTFEPSELVLSETFNSSKVLSLRVATSRKVSSVSVADISSISDSHSPG